MFYFDFRRWFAMLRVAWRGRPGRTRRKLLSLLLLRVPGLALLNALCFALDPLLFPQLRRTQVRAPIFIIGHARSGTTHFHELMLRDEGRFSAFLMWELFFAALLPKKLARAAAAADRRWLGGALERHMRRRSDARYSKTSDAHRQAYDVPEEDDGVLTYSCASGAWTLRVPDLDEIDFHYVDERPPAERRRLMHFYRECLRRQLVLNESPGSEKIHLSKNPTFCGRVESLIEAFPDARFIVLYRNPLETIPSLLKLLNGYWQIRGLDAAKVERGTRAMAEISFDSYLAPMEVFERHPQVVHVDVDYRELIAEPRETVEKVYRALELPLSAEYVAILESEQEKAKEHSSSHRYSLEEFGLTEAGIRERLAPLFDRFGW